MHPGWDSNPCYYVCLLCLSFHHLAPSCLYCQLSPLGHHSFLLIFWVIPQSRLRAESPCVHCLPSPWGLELGQ